MHFRKLGQKMRLNQFLYVGRPPAQLHSVLFSAFVQRILVRHGTNQPISLGFSRSLINKVKAINTYPNCNAKHKNYYFGANIHK